MTLRPTRPDRRMPDTNRTAQGLLPHRRPERWPGPRPPGASQHRDSRPCGSELATLPRLARAPGIEVRIDITGCLRTARHLLNPPEPPKARARHAARRHRAGADRLDRHPTAGIIDRAGNSAHIGESLCMQRISGQEDVVSQRIEKSPSATASGTTDRLLCPDPVRHMSVISGSAELTIAYGRARTAPIEVA
jgi:hypothetical protein